MESATARIMCLTLCVLTNRNHTRDVGQHTRQRKPFITYRGFERFDTQRRNTPHSSQHHTRGWHAVWGAFFILSINYGARYSFGVFVEPMFVGYGWSLSAISLAATINLVCYAVGGVLTGWLLDRMVPKWIAVGGTLLTTAGFLLVIFVSKPWHLYVCYGILCGLGSAGIGVVVCSSYVGKWFASGRGLAIGIATTGIGFGTMIFPPLAGAIVTYLTWQTGFLVFGVTILFTGLIVSHFVMGLPHPVGEKPSPSAPPVVEHIGGAKPATKLFLSFPLIRDGRFWIISGAFAAAILVEMSVYVHQVGFAISEGIAPMAAASTLGIIGISSIAGRFVFGWLSDRLADPKYSAMAGFGIMAIGIVILTLSHDMAVFYLFATVFGFGYGSLAPMMPLLVADRFGRSVLGTTYGLVTFIAVGIGGALGPVTSGVIVDISGSYRIAWYVDILLLIVAVLLVSLLGGHSISVDRD